MTTALVMMTHRLQGCCHTGAPQSLTWHEEPQEQQQECRVVVLVMGTHSHLVRTAAKGPSPVRTQGFELCEFCCSCCPSEQCHRGVHGGQSSVELTCWAYVLCLWYLEWPVRLSWLVNQAAKASASCPVVADVQAGQQQTFTHASRTVAQLPRQL